MTTQNPPDKNLGPRATEPGHTAAEPAAPRPDTSLWIKKIEAEPQHSLWFIQRFRDLIAAGKDIAGEARFADAMAPRHARILDAGCGSGRTGGPLAALGHTVIGVDVDPALIAAAREDYPDVTWLVGDLAELDAAAPELGGAFDLAIAAGNVLPFLAPSTRRPVLTNLAVTLKPGGRCAVGFGAGRGYPFADFFEDCAATGWAVTARFRGWNMLPFEADSDFLVAVMEPSGASAGRASAGRRAADPRLSGRRLRTLPADPMGGNSLRPLA